MVLKRLKIQDYLSIRGTVSLDIDPRVSILLGANDHGKSNILRALCCLNREQAISEEDRNWDAESPPMITFEFDLKSAEQEGLLKITRDAFTAAEAEKAKLSDILGPLPLVPEQVVAEPDAASTASKAQIEADR